MADQDTTTSKPVGIFVDNGKVSYSRVTGAVLSGAYLFMAIVTVLNGGLVPDIPQNLALLIGGLYGLNKVPRMLGK